MRHVPVKPSRLKVDTDGRMLVSVGRDYGIEKSVSTYVGDGARGYEEGNDEGG